MHDQRGRRDYDNGHPCEDEADDRQTCAIGERRSAPGLGFGAESLDRLGRAHPHYPLPWLHPGERP